MRYFVILTLVLSSASACKSEEAGKTDDKTAAAKGADTAKATPAAKKVDMKAMKLTAAGGWEGQFNDVMASWTYEKYVPGPDDMNMVGGRFYVDVWDDKPKDAAGYANKLTTEESFQDMGYIWPEVTKQEPFDGGWVILGKTKDTSDGEVELAFVVRLDKFNLSCRGDAKTEELRAEEIAACKSIGF